MRLRLQTDLNTTGLVTYHSQGLRLVRWPRKPSMRALTRGVSEFFSETGSVPSHSRRGNWIGVGIVLCLWAAIVFAVKATTHGGELPITFRQTLIAYSVGAPLGGALAGIGA